MKSFLKETLASLLIGIFLVFSCANASDLNRVSLKEIEEMPMPDYLIKVKESFLPDFIVDIIESIQVFFGVVPDRMSLASVQLSQAQLHQQLLLHVKDPQQFSQRLESYDTAHTPSLPNIYLKPTTELGQKNVFRDRHQRGRNRIDRENYAGRTVIPHQAEYPRSKESFSQHIFPNRDAEIKEAILKNGFH